MITRDESDRVRQRLLEILNEDAHNTTRLIDRLDAISRETGVDAHSALLYILTRLEFEEDEARRHWSAILSNREALSEALGREVGARVALLDYFMNTNRRLVKPTLIDLELHGVGGDDGTQDPVTGLQTGDLFRSQVQSEVRRARRYQLPLSVVLMDLDSFKAVNANVGKLVGDRVLREAAALLANSCRDIDRAARPGEDEFALLLPETSRAGAVRVAERFRRKLESEFARRDGQSLGLTISAGVATYPQHAKTPERLLECAAQALYQAKALGKNRVEEHQAERRRFARHELEPRCFEIEVLAPSDHGAVHARNLSREGILFSSPEPIEVGEQIEIRLLSESGEQGSFALRVRGWVVRLEEIPEEPTGDLKPGDAGASDRNATEAGPIESAGEGDLYEIGVAFDRSRSESADRLMAFLTRARMEQAQEPSGR